MDPLYAPMHPQTATKMTNHEAAEVILALSQYYKCSIPFGDSEIREAVARAVALLYQNKEE